MQIGVMNDSRLNLEQEILYAAEHRFDFIDLTLEPPLASPEMVDLPKIRRMIKDAGMGIVGHTAYYLPFDSPYLELRRTGAGIIRNAIEAFRALECEKIALHLNTALPHFILLETTIDIIADLWTSFLEDVMPAAEQAGARLMLENCPSLQNISLYEKLLGRFGKLGLHLDVGHANLGPGGNKTREMLGHFGDHLIHVHLSDNFGKEDLHLPIGAGNIDWRDSLDALKHLPYDDTITLEVFSRDRDYLLLSRDKIRSLWASL